MGWANGMYQTVKSARRGLMKLETLRYLMIISRHKWTEHGGLDFQKMGEDLRKTWQRISATETKTLDSLMGEIDKLKHKTAKKKTKTNKTKTKKKNKKNTNSQKTTKGEQLTEHSMWQDDRQVNNAVAFARRNLGTDDADHTVVVPTEMFWPISDHRAEILVQEYAIECERDVELKTNNKKKLQLKRGAKGRGYLNGNKMTITWENEDGGVMQPLGKPPTPSKSTIGPQPGKDYFVVWHTNQDPKCEVEAFTDLEAATQKFDEVKKLKAYATALIQWSNTDTPDLRRRYGDVKGDNRKDTISAETMATLTINTIWFRSL